MCLAFFTLYYIFQNSSTAEYYFFARIYTLCLFIHQLIDFLNCLQWLAIRNKAATNIGVQVFMWVHFLCASIMFSGLLSLSWEWIFWVLWYLNAYHFERLENCFSKRLYAYIIITMYEGSKFSTSLSTHNSVLSSQL